MNLKKSIIAVITFVLFAQISFAEESDPLDSPSELIRDFDSQRVITPQDFEKTLNKMKKPEKKSRRQHTELMPSSVVEEIEGNDFSPVMEKYSAVLMIPTTLAYENGIIPQGYYKICAIKKNDENYYICFYQGREVIATVKAFLTKNNFEQSAINYVNLLPYSSEAVKLIYGSVDYNLETLLRIISESKS